MSIIVLHMKKESTDITKIGIKRDDTFLQTVKSLQKDLETFSLLTQESYFVIPIFANNQQFMHFLP